MTVVRNTLRDGAAGPVVGAVIQAALVGSGFSTDGSSQVVRSVSTVSGSDGSWSLNLTAQSALEAPSYYVLREDGKVYTLTVPDTGPADLRDCLVDPPVVGLQEVGLSRAVADTLYDPLGGGGGGGISQVFADGRYAQKASNLSDLASSSTARTNLGLGSAATQASTAFDAAGAATAAQAASLQKASNLSDLASAPTARTNLGLGTAATQASTAFDAAGAASAAQAASLQKASNLSDLADVPTARTNLGLGTAATQAATAFDAAGAATAAQAASLQKASNLSDLANAATARTNLGARGAAEKLTPAEQHGYLGESLDPASANASVAPTSGQVVCIRVYVPKAATISSIGLQIVTAGSGLTAGQNLLGLYDDAGNLLTSTADQTAAWGTSGGKVAALTVAQAVAADSYVRVALLSVGTTPPTFRTGSSSGVAPGLALSGATLRFGAGASGLTALPASISPAGLVAAISYLVVLT